MVVVPGLYHSKDSIDEAFPTQRHSFYVQRGFPLIGVACCGGKISLRPRHYGYTSATRMAGGICPGSSGAEHKASPEYADGAVLEDDRYVSNGILAANRPPWSGGPLAVEVAAPPPGAWVSLGE